MEEAQEVVEMEEMVTLMEVMDRQEEVVRREWLALGDLTGELFTKRETNNSLVSLS